MCTEVQPVKYVREITLVILQTYIKNKIDIEIIQGIMINFDDRHFRKGDYLLNQKMEAVYAHCTADYYNNAKNKIKKPLIAKIFYIFR